MAKEGFTLLDKIDETKNPPKHWFSTPTPDVKGYTRYNFLIKTNKIRNEYKVDERTDKETLKELARISYFEHIGASIGIASFISFWILFFGMIFSLLGKVNIPNTNCIIYVQKSYCEFILPIITMIITSIICYAENRLKIEQLKNILDNL
ncbi:MAG: hypothetical protein JSW60_04350 [Thermoplasmatales archaeon]|nr:MAG: hypothetical protein JSW60_04350 [Thermoplasmatales archaeon]